MSSQQQKVVVPARLKPISAYIRRAEELDLVSGGNERYKIVAYYCRAYAMDLGIKLNDKSETVQKFLMDLMARLEKDKQDIVEDKEAGKRICEEHAIAVFAKADKEDREGRATKVTAKNFYAAGTFFEILKQFSSERELEPQFKDKALYSKFKATDILNALKEGRKPKPGPPDDSDDEGKDGGDNAGTSDSNGDLTNGTRRLSRADGSGRQSFSKTSDAPGSKADLERQSSILESQGKSKTSGRSSTNFPSVESYGEPLKSLPKANREEAIDFARFAIKAIQTDEVELAIANLHSALQLLHKN